MNSNVTAGLMLTILILGITMTSFGQTDAATSVVPPGVLFEALAINRDLPTKAKPKYNSTTDLAVSPDKTMLFVAQQTAKRIDIVDLATGTVVGSIRLPNEVTGMAVSRSSDLMYVTCSSEQWPAGKVCIVDISARSIISIIAVGNGARAPVMTPDGLLLFVCNRFDNDLSVIDLQVRTQVRRITMVREPYCAAVSPDGKTVVVGNYLPKDRSTDTNTIASMVTLVDVEKLDVEKNIRLPRGSNALTGIAVSPDGKYGFVTHTIGNFMLITSTVAGGFCNHGDMSIIDLGTQKYMNTVTLDYPRLGRANPWDIVISSDQRYLCITHAGSHSASVINYPALMDSVKAYTLQEKSLIKKHAVLANIRKRVELGGGYNDQLTGWSPRSLIVMDSIVYTAGYFDDEGAAIQKCNITADSLTAVQFQIGQKVSRTMERQGEANFYDARLCYQTWQSCHTCHPFTRANGLNRILGGGSITTPKNTQSMLYSWWTPPTSWIGRRGHAREAIKAGIQLELFQSPKDEVSVPLDTFIMALTPVPSPLLEKGRLSEAAQRGKSLFFGEKAQCSSCHSGPYFTDCKPHETAVQDPYDSRKDIYTPSLGEVWRSGPYGHIGSLLSVREMIELPGHNQATEKLSAKEMDDLVAYVMSL